MQNGTRADKADTRNDLRRNSRVVAGMCPRQLIGQEGKHGRAKTDKEIGSQTRGPVLGLALQTDQAAQERCQGQFFQVAHNWRHLLPSQLTSPNFARILTSCEPDALTRHSAEVNAADYS